MSGAASIEGFKSLDLGASLSAIEPRTCFDYAPVLCRLSEKLDGSGNSAGGAAALLLAKVCYFYFRPEWPGNPWGPSSFGMGSRSVTAEDLSATELDVLATIAGELGDAELRARVADVLWECKRGHEFARMAIKAYHQRAVELEDPNDWSRCIETLERAVDLAASIGRRKDLHMELLDHVEQLALKYGKCSGSGFFAARLMGILLENRHGDPTTHAALCETLAVDFQKDREWNLAEKYWDLASAWHRRGKADTDAERCQRSCGECLIARGQDQTDRQRLGSSYSAGWLMRGIVVLRRSSADPLRLETLQKELLEQQRIAMGEYQTFEVPGMDEYREAQKQCAERMHQHLTGHSLEEMIARFASSIPYTNTSQLRESLISRSGGSLRFAVGVASVDGEGKIAAVVEGASLSEGPREDQLQAAMFEDARRSGWPIACDLMIEPARQTIIAEHRVRRQDLNFLVHGNPFVHPGHEAMYLRGIHAGFHGDFMGASHFLIPQLEQSIRMVIRGHGVNTSTIEGDTQKERDLGWLLTHEKAKEAFEPDLLFDLRGILVEKFGENLRNNLCHGLIPAEIFYESPGSSYCWWITLRLLWLGLQNERA